MKRTVFTGCRTALLTAMKEDLSVHYEALGKLIAYQIEHNAAVLIIPGTTGKSAPLSDKEHLKSRLCRQAGTLLHGHGCGRMLSAVM